MIVGWTGHRPELFRDPADAEAVVRRVARELRGCDRFVVGGQRGVDTWAAIAAIDLAIPFTVYLPLPADDFVDELWSSDDRQVLQRTLARAAEVRVIGGHREAAFRERNRLVATSAHLIVAVWTGRAGGGTAETINFARESAVAVREERLAPAPNTSLARGRGI